MSAEAVTGLFTLGGVLVGAVGSGVGALILESIRHKRERRRVLLEKLEELSRTVVDLVHSESQYLRHWMHEGAENGAPEGAGARDSAKVVDFGGSQIERLRTLSALYTPELSESLAAVGDSRKGLRTAIAGLAMVQLEKQGLFARFPARDGETIDSDLGQQRIASAAAYEELSKAAEAFQQELREVAQNS